jgi:hypothetical protein
MSCGSVVAKYPAQWPGGFAAPRVDRRGGGESGASEGIRDGIGMGAGERAS